MKKILNNKIILYLILALATFLRFYNYHNRWGLAYDQARDFLVGYFALNNGLIPLIGAFSSAGQFVYGPQWFWIISLMSAVFPSAIATAWIVQTLLYILSVYFMFLIGKELFSEKFGLLLAFLTAISNTQVLLSTNLTSPSIVGIFSVFCTFFFIKVIKYSKPRDFFILAFLVSTTVNIHFQAVGLFFLLIIAFLTKIKLKNLLLIFLGIIIPFIPLIIFDLKTNFFETRNMIDYYLYGQQRLYVPNRWLTYAGVFWPKSWSEIIGNQIIIGYFFMVLLGIFSIIDIVKRKMKKEFFALLVITFLIFVMLRYYKGFIFGSYLIFINPFILIFSSYVSYKLYKVKSFIFYIVLLVITFSTMTVNWKNLNEATNKTAADSFRWTNDLIKKYPDKKFAFYDYRYEYSEKSLAFSLYMYNRGKIDDNGFRVGVVRNAPDIILREITKFPIIYNKSEVKLIDLNSSSSADLVKNNWVFINPSGIYESTEGWYKNK